MSPRPDSNLTLFVASLDDDLAGDDALTEDGRDWNERFLLSGGGDPFDDRRRCFLILFVSDYIKP